MSSLQQDADGWGGHSPSPAEEAALRWVVRCERGLTPAEAQEFAAWRQDPQNARLWAEFQGTWALLEAPPAARRPMARLLRWPAAIVGMAAGIALLFALFPFASREQPTTTVTAVGEMRTLELPDGSRVTLNTDTVVEVAFTPGERRVLLRRGQSHFEVAKDAARPFVVHASGVDVRAVGTAFDVRLGSRNVDVLVTEGTVSVAKAVSEPGRDPVMVTAGKRAVVPMVSPTAPRPVEVRAVPPEDLVRKMAWRERRIEFVSASLREIVEEFNRYNRHQLVVEDAELAEAEFGGAFRVDDQAGLLRMLRANFGIHVETRGDRTWLRYAGTAETSAAGEAR